MSEDGQSVLSVFVTPGVINVDALPGGTSFDWVGRHQVWLVPWDAGVVLMAQRGDSVVTIMGPEPLAPAMAEQVNPPTPGDSITDRVQAAGKGLLQAFGLG